MRRCRPRVSHLQTPPRAGAARAHVSGSRTEASMRLSDRLAIAGLVLSASVTLAAAQTSQDHDTHHPVPSGQAPMQQRPAMRAPMQPGTTGMMGGDTGQMMSMMSMMTMMR